MPFLRSRLSIPPQIARQYLAVAAGIGIVDDLTGPVLVPPPVWLQDAQDILTRHGCRGVKTVLIAPGGRHGTKIWPAERWIKLVEQMRLTGFEEFILIGAGDDFAPAVKIAAALPFPVVNLCGRTSIAELTGMIASAKLLICGDSGPMHIAAGTGTPVVAIFGPTVQEFGFAPFTEKARVVEVTNLSCRPCHPHGPAKCPQKHFRCMLEITPELVLQKALELAKPLVQS